MKKIFKISVTIGLSLLVANCSITEKDATGKNKSFEPNIKVRTERATDSTTLFGSKKQDSFQSNNILWRATVESLKFMPTASASYTGGLYVTDWYGSTAKEKIKIMVRFKSKELSSNSIEIDAFKRICSPECVEQSLGKDFTFQIKSKIIDKAREINIAETQKK